MAVNLHSDVLDNGPQYIKTYCTRQVACSAQPTTYTEANATYMLANVTVDSTDFTLGAGSVSGRRITIAQQLNITISASGNATYIALLDVANSKLLGYTTCALLALTGGQLMNFAAWGIEFRAPVAA